MQQSEFEVSFRSRACQTRIWCGSNGSR